MQNFSAQFERLLAARAGLRIRTQERALVEERLKKCAQSRQMDAAQYLEWLQSADSASEWNRLFALMTNQESYFFRDSGQFALLREHILPELIARNHARRTLKLWSAGCSTGEEAYSLAMTLDALLPFQDDWKVEIHATDLSEIALEKARTATYSAWSFRSTPKELRDRYFQNNGDKWVLEERLRERVTFRQSNLMDELQELSDCDLILCRNVFIYFRREAVAQAVRKLCDVLRTGGYLVTGHAELHGISLPDLETRRFAQSVVHQRTSSTRLRGRNPENAPLSATNHVLENASAPFASMPFAAETSSRFSSPNAMIAARTKVTHEATYKNEARNNSSFAFDAPRDETQSDKLEMVRNARDSLRAGKIDNALPLLQKVLQSDAAQNRAAHFGAHCLIAQHHANNARYDEAVSFCAHAILLDTLAPLPYHVQARIEEERGHRERAKALLKKVIYLAPRSVVATMELSAIYSREGDAKRAKNWRDAALQLLIEYSNDETVEIPEWSLDETQCVEKLKAHLQDEK